MRTFLPFGAFVVLTLNTFACSSTTRPREPELETAQTLESGDCSTALGDCYVGCQGHAPTPEASCFTGCERTFRKCLDLPELEQTAQ